MLIDNQFEDGAGSRAQSIAPGPDGQWVMPESVALFTADFGRDSDDLILRTQDGVTLRLDGYFAAEVPADLLSSEGAVLRASVVERLAGPLFPAQYAQAGGAIEAEPIGQVETLDGIAFVQRTDGQVVQLDIGTKVFQGDVVSTNPGSGLGLTFADGTIFTLASGSRMVLDELIYDPDASDNSAVFNLIEGSFVFIAGQAAKTGGIDINTPAATMGIRGTTGKIDVTTLNGVATVRVSLNPDPDGGLGVIVVTDLLGNLIATISSTDEQWIIRPPFTNEPPIRLDRDDVDVAQDAPLLDQARAAFDIAAGRVAQGQEFVQTESEDIEPTDDLPDDGESEEPEGDDLPPVIPPLDETGDATEGDGESGGAQEDLDGNDEPIVDPEGASEGEDEDDAGVDPANTDAPTTDFAQNNNGSSFEDIEVQVAEDNSLTSRLPVDSATGDPIPVTLTRAPENGAVELTDDGTFTYTPDPDFEGTDSFVVTGLDDSGEEQDAEITVVVDPVNDAPVVSLRLARATASEEDAGGPDGAASVSGTLTYVDVDEGNTPGSWSIAPAAGNATALGIISIDADTGFWQYALDEGAADGLTNGQSVEETFFATVTDAEGESDVTELVITIAGTNDTPVISVASGSTDAALITGPGAADNTDPDLIATGSVSGVLSYTDVDEGSVAATWSIAADPSNETALGAITIDADTGAWTFTLASDQPAPLGSGETVTQVYLATVTDAGGASAQQAISISITGTNDAPIIEFSIEDISATVVEDGFVPGAEEDAGTIVARIAAPEQGIGLNGDSADAGDALVLANVDGTPDATGTLRYVDSNGNSTGATWTIAAQDARLGEMTIDAVTGEWHYCLDQDAADSLRAGDEVIETFLATITDASGSSASQVITITVQGANDQAELTTAPSELVGTVAEDGAATASGQLNFDDPDALPGEAATWSIAPDGATLGAAEIDAATGQWTYVISEEAANGLAGGAPTTETFTASVTDSFGAVANQTITITLIGQNDAPLFAAGNVTVAKSAENIAVELSALGSDADVGDDGSTLSYELVGTPVAGSASIDGTILTFNVDGAFNELSTGQTQDVELQVLVTDSFGATTTGIVVVTVTGSDTGPVITSAAADALGTVVEEGGGAPGTPEITGTLTYDDADATTPTSGAWSVDPETSTLGAITIDSQTGEWRYTLDNVAANALNQGQSVEEEFVATITDESGLTATQVITITITGTNDAPSLDAAIGDVDANEANVAIDLSQFGVDPDAEDDGQSLTYDLETGPAAGSGSAVVEDGILTFSTDGDFDGLALDEARVVTVQVGVTDSRGLRTVSDVLLTVTGVANQPPVITSESADAAGLVSENGVGVAGEDAATGQLTYDDPDAATATSGRWSLDRTTALIGESVLGTMSIDEVTGAWRFELNENTSDRLDEGDSQTEEFTATVTDEDGLTATQVITITISGTNDRPVVTAESQTIDKSDATVDFDLALLSSDVDQNDTDERLIYAIEAQPGSGRVEIDGSVVTFFTDTDFADLDTGDSREVTFDVRVTDPQGAFAIQTMTVLVTGSNEPPVITSEASAAQGAVTEQGEGVITSVADVTPDAQGQLTYTDADERAGNPGQWSVAPDSATPLGTLNIDPDTGGWGYFLNQASADSLFEGEVVTETYTATVTDEFGATADQVITITITGRNDAPEVLGTSVTTGSIGSEIPVTLTGQLAFSDPDDIETLGVFWSIERADAGGGEGGPPAPFGSMTISGAGVWNYAVDRDAVETIPGGEQRTETYRATVRDEFGAFDTIDIVINIDGTNIVPTITSTAEDAQGTVVENGDPGPGDPSPAEISGQLAVDDPDDDGTAPGWSIAVPAGADTVLNNDGGVVEAIGTMAIDAQTGEWTFTLDDLLSNSLDAGDTVQNVFTAVYEDAAGAQVQQEITITIEGTNDSPTLNANAPLVSQTGFVNVNLLLLSDDPDADDTDALRTFEIAPGDFKGTASITNGILNFDTNGEFSNVPEGELEEVTFSVIARDGNGGEVTTAFTIRVLGRNDGPVIDQVNSDAETQGAVEEELAVSGSGPGGGSGTASGTLTYTDVDEDPLNPATWSIQAYVAELGDIVIDADTGEWEYTLDQAAANSLNEGQEVTEEFTAVVTDEFGATDTQRILITITGRNDTPTLDSRTLNINEDSTGVNVALALLGDDPDAEDDGGSLTYSLVGIVPAGASLSNGILSYTPDAALQALDLGDTQNVVVNVQALDTQGAITTNTVIFAVAGLNDAPTLPDLVRTTTEDDVLLVDLTGLGSDVDEDAVLSYVVTNAPADGFTQLLGNTVRFDPDGDFETLGVGQSEVVNVTVRSQDENSAQSADATLAITITGVNDAPTLVNASRVIAEDNGTLFIGLAGSASDVDATQDINELSYTVTSNPALGSVLAAAGGVSFDPGSDFDFLADGESQQVSFTVRAVDDEGAQSAEATIFVTVNGINNGPETPDFTFDYASGTGTVVIDVLAEATGGTGALNISSFSDGGFGVVRLDDRGTDQQDDDVLLYTPAPVTSGADDTFTYTIQDADGTPSTGTVTVINVPANAAPTADAASETIQLVSRSGTEFVGNTDNFYQFVRGYYTWEDARAEAASKGGYLATLTSTVENTAGASIVAAAGGDIDAWLGATDAAAEGTWRWVDGPLGTLDGGQGLQFWQGVAGSGSAIGGNYENWGAGQPNSADAASLDHLVIRRDTGEWDDVNNSDARGYLLELERLSASGSLASSVSDPDVGDTLTFIQTNSVAGFTLSSTGVWTFDVHDATYLSLTDGEFEPLTVTYIVQDQRGASDFGELTLNLFGANDAPVVVDEDENLTLSTTPATADGDVSTNDSDPDGDAAGFTYALSGTYDGLTMNSDGTWEFDLDDPAYSGLGPSDTQIIQAYYEVTDEGGATSNGRLRLILTGAANEAPVLGADTVNVTAESGTAITPDPGWTQWDSGAGANEHYYDYVTGSFEWSEARADALAKGGYLATITSEQEQDFVETLGSWAAAFIGGSDAAVEGEWRWADGPEAGQQFWQGSGGGSALGYENWDAGQPSDTLGDENAAHLRGDGTWNDIVDGDIPALGSTFGYIFEFGGPRIVAGDISLNDSDPNGDAITYTPSGSLAGATLNSDGTFIFDPTDPAYRFLAEGQTQNFNLSYVASDGTNNVNGSIVFAVTGTNDAPTFSSLVLDAVTESDAAFTIDLLDGVTDADTTDTLTVSNFMYTNFGDGPSPELSPEGTTSLELDPGDFASLNTGEQATLVMTYDVSDGTSTVQRTATISINGESPATITAENDFLGNSADPAVMADGLLTIPFAKLIENDLDPSGLGLNVTVAGPEFDQGNGTFSQFGGYVTVGANDIFYNPGLSTVMSETAGDSVQFDSFYYTIESDDGTLSSTASIGFFVNGVAETSDGDPVSVSRVGVGFNSQVGTQYRVNPNFMGDDDGSPTSGITYKLGETNPDGPLPDFLNFSLATGFAELSVDTSAFDGSSPRVNNLFLTGFENDGDYRSVPFSLVLDSVGDIRYTVYGYNTTEVPQLVEIGIDDTASFGGLGESINVDLTGIDATTPFAMPAIDVLDMRNGQANLLQLDTDELLTILSDNASGSSQTVTIQTDSYDTVEIQSGNAAGGDTWNLDVNGAQTSALVVGTGGDLAGITLTLELDGTQFVVA